MKNYPRFHGLDIDFDTKHIGGATLVMGDCLDVLRAMPDSCIDSVVTDPPYGLKFMGKHWDYEVPSVAIWAECLRVLKPGGHMLAFSGSRTYHRMVCAIEDGGFEIRDQIMWVYGSGFPKSLDVSKAIDKSAGANREKSPTVAMQKKGDVGEISKNLRCAECGKARASGNPCVCPRLEDEPATEAARQWQGWGTALKPAHEPICVARKPLIGTVAANVLHWGTGALNIDACRVATEEKTGRPCGTHGFQATTGGFTRSGELVTEGSSLGRWPANLIHDGSDAVLADFPQAPGQQANVSHTAPSNKTANVYGAMKRVGESSQDSANEGTVGFKMKPGTRRLDVGSAARFFYCAKASKKDRGVGNTHPTVKPIALMEYLIKLVTPLGGLVADPFTGSGSTGVASMNLGHRFLGIERDLDSFTTACRRVEDADEL